MVVQATRAKEARMKRIKKIIKAVTGPSTFSRLRMRRQML
jgi:hypothetical protein